MNNDRQMYNVDLSCAECKTAITHLPFEPTGDKPVYCTTCLRARRDSRGNSRDSRGPRQMYQVNEKCAECNAAITQLPFKPSGGKPLYCFDCVKARRQ